MINIEKQILPLIESQFPGFYKQEEKFFVEFIKAYYEWMSLSTGAVGQARRIASFRDIDTTIEQFYVYFRKKYLDGFPEDIDVNTPILVKKALDIYKAKGTEQGVKLLMRLLYDADSSVYLPGLDVIKPSHGTWSIPQYIELEYSDRTRDFISKEIIGERSRARAFAESLVTRRVEGKTIDVLYLSNLQGRFVYGERVTLLADRTTEGAPTVIGSLSSIDILTSGADYSIGDVLTVTSEAGKQGLARVTGLSQETGLVSFELINGGFGYTNTSPVYVSNRVLNLSTRTNADSSISGPDPNLDYIILENVTQSIYRYGVTGVTNANNLVANTILTKWTAGVQTFQGRIIDYQLVTASTGILRVYPTLYAGNVNISDTLYTPSNTQSFTVANTLNSTASGFVIGSKPLPGGSSIWSLGLANVQNEFLSTNVAPVIGSVSNTYGYISSIGSGEGATFSIGLLTNQEDQLLNSDYLNGNNVVNVPYMVIRVDGSNSGIAANGYGFPKKPSANLNSKILEALTIASETFGTIAQLTGIDRGQDYTQDPMVLVAEPITYPLGARDYQLRTSNNSGAFLLGEEIRQVFSTPLKALTVSNFANTGNLEIGEVVTQANSLGSWPTGGSYGIVYSFSKTGSLVTSIVVKDVAGQGFVSGTAFPLTGTSGLSGATANINAVTTTSATTSAKGIVSNFTNSTYFDIKRISLANNFTLGGSIFGVTSGATANIADIVITSSIELEADRLSTVGLNANITANVQIANNTVANLEIISSGFGYLGDETVTLYKEGSNEVVTGKANVSFGGIGEGFYTSTRGFISADKFIHDSDFYQEYSYQVLSRVPFEKYKDVLRKVMHVLGTRMFGKVEVVSVSNTEIEQPDQGTYSTFAINDNPSYTVQPTSLLPEVSFNPLITIPAPSNTIALENANSFYAVGGRVQYRLNKQANITQQFNSRDNVVANTSSITFANNSNLFANGDHVQYITSAEEVGNLSNGSFYYVKSANSSSLTLSPTFNGVTISVQPTTNSNVFHYLVSSAASQQSIGGLVANNSYYVKLSNTSAIQLASTPTGAAIDVDSTGLCYSWRHSFGASPLIVPGDTLYQNTATTNTLVVTAITPLQTTITSWPVQNQVVVGTVLYYPTIGSPAMSAVVVAKEDNVASNRTTLYLDNVTGVFPDNLNLQYADSYDGVVRTLWAIKTINTFTAAVSNGSANTLTPLRLQDGTNRVGAVYETIGLS